MLGAQVRLVSEDGEIDLTQTPAEDGSYFFDGVMPGRYTLHYQMCIRDSPPTAPKPPLPPPQPPPRGRARR